MSLLPPVVAAGTDALEAYRREVRALDAEERAYFEAFPARQREALDARSRVLSPRGNANVGAAPASPNAAFVRLARPLASLEERRGEAALSLAGSGHPRAAAVLLDAAFDLAEAAEGLDAALLAARPTLLGHIHDQTDAFRRQALADREDRLLTALVAVPGAVTFLASEGWAQALVKDGKRSACRRILVLDTLGRAATPDALAILGPATQAPLLCVRVAALEAAARCGPTAEPVLAQALDDPHVLVRRAALDALRALAPSGGRTLSRLLARLTQARGVERTKTLATLQHLSGQSFGDDPGAWSVWLVKRRPEIDAGTFDVAKEPKAAAATVAPGATPPRFYGLPLAPDGIVFVVDWTLAMTYPADLAFARAGKPIDWFGGDPAWVGRSGQERQQTVVRRELVRALAGLGERQHFGVVALRDGTRDAWPKFHEGSVLGQKGLLPADAKSLALLDALFEGVPPGWSRWHEHMDGLWIAADLARLGPGPLTDLGTPAADTLVLVSDGRHRGGRFVLAKAEVAAFARWNRFRRFVVHTVRIADEGADAVTLMEGFARVSGGTHVHAVKAP